MSIAQMDLVWKYSKARGNERLVLLAIADCANDEGLAWPSAERIAAKALVHRATAVRLQHALEKRGEIRVERSRGQTSNRYYVTIQPSQSATVAECDRRNSDVQPSQIERPTVAPVRHEPSENRQRTVSKECVLPSDFTLTAERERLAREHGCTNPRLAFEAFKASCEERQRRSSKWGLVWFQWCLHHDQFGCPCQGRSGGKSSPGVGRAVPSAAATRQYLRGLS